MSISFQWADLVLKASENIIWKYDLGIVIPRPAGAAGDSAILSSTALPLEMGWLIPVFGRPGHRG